MWINYFKIAWRAMKSDLNYSSINILGLSLGLASCLLVGTVVLDELSYDNFWSNKDRLYRIVTVDNSTGMEDRLEVAYSNFGTKLQENFPEVEAAGSVSTSKSRFRIGENDTDAIQMNLIQADTGVWELLNFSVVQGNPQHYVAGIGNLIVTEEFSAAHFKGESPVGKTVYSVSPYQDKARPFFITGVIKDIPSNTYLRADGIQVYSPSKLELSREGWGYYDEQMVLLQPYSSVPELEEKINNWYAPNHFFMPC